MIIGITGYAGVGKDTLADLLVETQGFEKRAFADKVREAYYEVAPVAHQELIDELGWDAAKRENMFIRAGLQGIGSMCRKVFGKDFWIKQALSIELGNNIVFSDVRYENEAYAIRKAGGIIIRLKRDGIEPFNDHESETNVDNIDPDMVIENRTPEQALKDVIELIEYLES